MRRRREREWYSNRRRKRRQRRLILAVVFVLFLGAFGGAYYYLHDFYQGTQMLEKEAYQGAVSSYEKAVKKGFNEAAAYRGMGIAYMNLEAYDEAAKNFLLAKDAGTTLNDRFYQLLGGCYMNLSKYENASDTYTEGLALETCDDDIYREMCKNRVTACEKAGDWEKAKEYIKDYVERYPDDEEGKKEAEFLETR